MTGSWPHSDEMAIIQIWVGEFGFIKVTQKDTQNKTGHKDPFRDRLLPGWCTWIHGGLCVMQHIYWSSVIVWTYVVTDLTLGLLAGRFPPFHRPLCRHLDIFKHNLKPLVFLFDNMRCHFGHSVSLLLKCVLWSVYIACKDGNFAYRICTYWH